MLHDVTVRDAVPADVPAIERIARLVWPATYGSLLDRGVIDRFLEQNYAPAALERDVAGAAAPDVHFLVATDEGGDVVGYLHFGPGEEAPELRRLYLRPDLTGRGLGTALLEELHRRLPEGTTYVLRVHPGNERARAFYRRHGFVEAARGGGGECGCDVVMRTTVRRPVRTAG